jgi:hypothetical protein
VTIYHSQNGWINKDMMMRYIEWLSQRCDYEPLILVLDVFKETKRERGWAVTFSMQVKRFSWAHLQHLSPLLLIICLGRGAKEVKLFSLFLHN